VETVTAEEVTFYLSDEGFVPEPVEGAVEAYRGTYAAGETEIGMLATLWPDNAAADAFAAQLLEGLDGREIATGSTYTNDAGTYWAYIIVEDGEERGTYVWTTDRGHVLQIVGTLDWVDRFYDSFPL